MDIMIMHFDAPPSGLLARLALGGFSYSKARKRNRINRLRMVI